jgi:hypothetical protein
MQTNKPGEHELVKICMEELCRIEGFANPENLVQRDLNFLCERITLKTGTVISLSTMKRLLNGQFSHLPQIATLDAKSAAYQNWQDFKFHKTLNNGSPAPTEAAPIAMDPKVIGTPPTKTGLTRTAFLLFFLSILLVTMGLLALIKLGKKETGSGEKAGFSAVKITGNDIPNTVVFTYNIDSVTADSFFIQQS